MKMNVMHEESSAGETSSTIKFGNIYSEIFAIHNPYQNRMPTPGTEVLLIGLSYALLVVNLKNNIFCLDYFDHDV